MGHTLQLQATAFDSAGRPVTPSRIVWRSTAPELVLVDSAGLALALTRPQGGGAILQALAPPSTVIGNIPLVVARHGDVKWRLSLSGMPSYGGVAEGPDGTLYYLSLDTPASDDRGTLYAITPKGAVKWQRPLTQVSENTPRIGEDGTIYVVGQYVWAINADGTLRWSVTTRPTNDPGARAFFHEAALSRDGILYATMGYDFFAFRASTGDTVWGSLRANDRGWLIAPSISADGRTVYVSRSTRALYGIDAATGATRWSAPDPDRTVESYVLGAALDGGVLRVPTAIRLRDVDTGGATLGSSADLGRGVSEPAIGPDGTLYFQAPQSYGLYAYRGASQELWRLEGVRSAIPLYGGPALAQGGVLYAAALDGFYAVNVSPSGGSVRWRYPRDPQLHQRFYGAPLIGRDGTVYSFTSTIAGQRPDGSDELFAFWEDKPVEPNSPWPMWRHDVRRSGQADR
jgi:outer membrane protein assembly factor BamB